jgi:hypothetical protein
MNPMKLGRSHPVPAKLKVAAAAALLLACLFLAVQLPSAPSRPAAAARPWNPVNWTATNSYPMNIDDQSCAASSGFIYCVGGSAGGSVVAGIGDVLATNGTYYAALYPDGALGNWIPAAAYPGSLYDLSCSAYQGVIYCVGGMDPTGTSYNSVYFAQLSPGGGIGPWRNATPYPIAVHNQACGVAGGFIYCVGGNSSSYGAGAEVNATYYAGITQTGALGNWTRTASYPLRVEDQACNIAGGFIYCVGGWVSGEGTRPDHTAESYYARISPSGIGPWKGTTPYPAGTADHKTCSATGGHMYCSGGYSAGDNVTGSTYYAQVNSSGIGQWTRGQDYGCGAFRSMAAASYGGYIYYVGGYRDADSVILKNVYYANTTAQNAPTGN